MQITSSAFAASARIPDEFTCRGSNINPPLAFQDVPEETHSLVLVMDDPDAPMGAWDHWLVYNIDPSVHEIAPGTIPPGGVEVANSFGQENYGGPCPPPGPKHRYFFKLYALSTMIDRSIVRDKPSLLSAIEPFIIAQAELIGTYSL